MVEILKDLSGFLMRRMLFAEWAVFAQFQTVRVAFFVFVGCVISLLAIRASERNFNARADSHGIPPYDDIS